MSLLWSSNFSSSIWPKLDVCKFNMWKSIWPEVHFVWFTQVLLSNFLIMAYLTLVMKYKHIFSLQSFFFQIDKSFFSDWLNTIHFVTGFKLYCCRYNWRRDKVKLYVKINSIICLIFFFFYYCRDLKVENLLLDGNKNIKIIGKCKPRLLKYLNSRKVSQYDFTFFVFFKIS